MPVENPKDPILKSGPDQQRELFNRFCREANGFSTEEVIGAACNLIINAIRQVYSTRQRAEARFDEIFGRVKTLLVGHYDQLGRKRGIFPYNQFIEPQHFVDKDEKRH